jgi:hypothetical protein
VSTTQSRLDPEALRERLRAFQSEFRTATDGSRGAETPEAPALPTTNADLGNADLGGDRR